MSELSEAAASAPCPGSNCSSPGVPVPDDFISSGRTGRRNALGDIKGQYADNSSAGLAEAMAGISTAGKHFSL
jgi:hypothetical protein